MIQVEQLTKHYGSAKALKGISFEVARGDVVGFLGPNGAGKSTTMKILTGYLLPTSGRALVDGLDVVTESLAVRRRIGYLPESTPLYAEMRVDEYLRFAAEIRGVRGRDVRAAIERVVETCGLARVVGRDILELSKGYRQRVGLAQAMVHQPDLLILDEPTSGLDPNQIIEVRALIERLREHHTVILSTHYLQEVEAVCSRVIVIDLGEIVADGTREELIGRLPPGPVLARIAAPADVLLAKLVAQLGAVAVRELGHRDGVTQVSIEAQPEAPPDGEPLEVRVAAACAHTGFIIVELVRERQTLEAAFRHLPLGRRGDLSDA